MAKCMAVWQGTPHPCVPLEKEGKVFESMEPPYMSAGQPHPRCMGLVISKHVGEPPACTPPSRGVCPHGHLPCIRFVGLILRVV
jgi:hypothetical protein